jgi:hypothetical protein
MVCMKTFPLHLPADIVSRTLKLNRTQAIQDAVAVIWDHPAVIGQELVRRAEAKLPQGKPTRVATTIDEETKDKLKEMASRTGLSMNQLAALALEAHLKAL